MNYVNNSDSNEFVIATERENLKSNIKSRGLKRFKDVDSFSNIKLKQKPFTIERVVAQQFKSDGRKIVLRYNRGRSRAQSRGVIPVVLGDTNEVTLTAGDGTDEYGNYNVSISGLQMVSIKYKYLEKIDPNFKG